MSRKLFGTDGVRGQAGPGGVLTAELALSLAQAAVAVIGGGSAGGNRGDAITPVVNRQGIDERRLRVLIVRDTRESGQMLEAAMAAGITAAGGDALLAGVLPTPAAPLLVRQHRFALAVVISASHNPYADNGIKLFASSGFKLDDETESQIEDRMREPFGAAIRIGRVQRFADAPEDYLSQLLRRFADLDLHGRRILLDCANGATYRVAPELFRRLGAHVRVLADEPSGRNINDGCGSTHIDFLAEAMKPSRYDIGFAFDGDGDRVLAVDRNGSVADGDELIALIAGHQQRAGLLDDKGVAVTVMTNFGFHSAMASAAIKVATTAVGDRYVLEELLRRGWNLGGEQSGHIIDLGFGLTGDGMASALLTLEALGGRDLSERDAMRKLPQQLVNVPASDREHVRRALASELAQAAITAGSERLDGRGRVLVRPSGTEPLIRVMVEAPTQSETDEVCKSVVVAITVALEQQAASQAST
jgi:phosphoglucosamine mutase